VAPDRAPQRLADRAEGSHVSHARPRVVIVRGHQTNSWHLRPWRHLTDRYDIVALKTRRTWFDTELLGFPTVETRALRDLLPPGRAGDLVARVPGDRYLGVADRLRGASIVHSQDLGFWYSMQAAKHRRELGYKLALTCWETIPFLGAYRNVRTRPYRELVLRETDLFLAATERARDCLLLEGAPEERIRVVPPGVDRELFAGAESAAPPTEHLIVSPGRLVWEKGHQDVLRALAALRKGLVESAAQARVLVIGAGPEEARLRRYASELGVADAVEIRPEVPYEEMPAIYARASCMVLGSLPLWFWEEQFGMVLAEAICAGVPILASSSGAIPEVLAGQAELFPSGDWVGLARLLAAGPLSRPPGTRASYDPALVELYSSEAAAERLATAYDELLAR
jgi:glycosyltransferase involved in cell wall biosynthesis